MNEPCVWCELTIPCRHTIQLGYIINIKCISKRFLRVTNDPQNLPNQVIISDDAVPVQKTRSSFLARIDPYVNLYGKNPRVDQILENALSDLESLQVRPNPGMPPTLAQQGHQFLYQSRNVMSGRQSTKRKYKCTQCGSTKHTKRNCPLKSIKDRLYGF